MASGRTKPRCCAQCGFRHDWCRPSCARCGARMQSDHDKNRGPKLVGIGFRLDSQENGKAGDMPAY